MTKLELQIKVDKNREEIDRLLCSDFPLDLLYIRVYMLTSQNERLIVRIKNL